MPTYTSTWRRALIDLPLTDKQMDVLLRRAKGQTLKEIARDLGLELTAVGSIFQETCRKLGGARTAPQAVDEAYQRGLFQLEPRIDLPVPLVDVLELVAAGCTNAEIASRLERSEYTVADQVKEARRRLGARDRAHAAALAVALRIVRVYVPPAESPASVEAA